MAVVPLRGFGEHETYGYCPLAGLKEEKNHMAVVPLRG